MHISLFDYELPKELIAQTPIYPRDTSRLMVLNDKTEHREFIDFINYLDKGDVLVLNNSKVIKARVHGNKETGGKVEILLVEQKDLGTWTCLVNGKNIKRGTRIIFNEDWAEVKSYEGLKATIEFYTEDFHKFLDKHGEMPIPPYIKTRLEDQERYQTVYADPSGSIAAPTAGLHFTPEMLRKIKEKGVTVTYITLHVGLGTFTPVRTEQIEEHEMESEYFIITDENARTIENRKGNLAVVGTTVVRALESVYKKHGKLIPCEESTDLFIYPGYEFRSPMSKLLTNFHLPRSTLLMLVSAFGGREKILTAYEEGVKEKYRFYSFGDAMLIKR